MAECLVAYDDAAYAAYEDLESCRDAQRARLTKHEQQVPNMGLSARPPVSRYQGAIMVTFTERLNC